MPLEPRRCAGCCEVGLPLKPCAGCKKVWYCSQDCQDAREIYHIFDCSNPWRPITTADYLALAAVENLLPQHPQTCEDYGFARAVDSSQYSKLLGLYIGLLHPGRLKVKPLTLHRWRLEGTLVENIKKEFERLPENCRGGYYPWFLQNQHLLSGAQTAQEKQEQNQSLLEYHLRRAWTFIGKPPNAPIAKVLQWSRSLPRYIGHCFSFYAMLLAGHRPGVDTDLWITLGFCACVCQEDEMQLARSYNTLIHHCTFDEFCTAYISSSLIELCRSKRISLEDPFQTGSPNACILDVLSGSPHLNKSVWNLKQHIVREITDGLDVEDNSIVCFIAPIFVDYGFYRCRTPEDRRLLFDLYKGFFKQKRELAPLQLHQACIQGRLFAYFTKDLQIRLQRKKIYKRLLLNPYPLPVSGPSSAIAGIALGNEEDKVQALKALQSKSFLKDWNFRNFRDVGMQLTLTLVVLLFGIWMMLWEVFDLSLGAAREMEIGEMEADGLGGLWFWSE